MNIFQELSRKQNKRQGRPPISEAEHLQENFGEFDKWYTSFIGRKGGHRPANTKLWFGLVQDSHLALRRRLDGVNRIVRHELQQMQKKVDLESIESIHEKLVDIGGLPDEPDDVEILRHPHGGRKGMKTTKHILEYAENYCFDKKKLNQLLEQLGQKWANAKTEKKTVYSIFDTSAKAFLMLGLYEVDHGSCFAQQGQHQIDKYTLAGLDNTFVLVIRKNDEFSHREIDQDDNLARMWGFHKPHSKTVNFCNLYVDHKFLRGNAVEICRQHSAYLLKTEPDNVKMIEDILEIKGVFHNKKAQNWTFYTGNEVPQTQKLS